MEARLNEHDWLETKNATVAVATCTVRRLKRVNFKDHFSGHSPDYSAYRPQYPADLFTRLAALCSENHLAWDCATGSGQAAVSMAQHFDHVIATDASDNQISHATACPTVEYRIATAENSGLAPNSIDLISVAQAVHWFDIEAFAAEVVRVLKPDGVLAVWTYTDISISTELDEPLDRFHADIVADYWPPEREMVDNSYADIDFPLEPIPFDALQMHADWNLAGLLGYLNTWSSVKAYQRKHGRNPVDLIQDELVQHWGAPARVREATWPLIVKAWRKPA